MEIKYKAPSKGKLSRVGSNDIWRTLGVSSVGFLAVRFRGFGRKIMQHEVVAVSFVRRIFITSKTFHDFRDAMEQDSSVFCYNGFIRF